MVDNSTTHYQWRIQGGAKRAIAGCIKGKINFENHHRSFFNMATMAAILNVVSAQ